MQMESETISLLYFGFIVVIVLVLIILIRLYFTHRHKGYAWFIMQIFFLVLSFQKFIYLIKRKPEMPELMASEENSLSLGIIGVWWALSMLCMVAGIYNIGRKNNRKKTK